MGTLFEARYDMHPQAKDKLNALLLEQKRGATATEETVERSLDSLLFESSCCFVERDVSTYRKNDDVWISDPFYSGPRGYKMCLEVYENGVEEVRGKYCSVFIRLMEGDFDGELPWPCRGSANVVLLNLSQPRGNVEKTIVFSFSRPVGSYLQPRIATGLGLGAFQPAIPGQPFGAFRHASTSAPRAGEKKFIPLGPGYSPYEINDCSWYEVRDIHIRYY